MKPKRKTAKAMRSVYSNKMFLFGPAAWGGQKICDREQGVLDSPTGFLLPYG
jgi:hypothetical protein